MSYDQQDVTMDHTPEELLHSSLASRQALKNNYLDTLAERDSELANLSQGVGPGSKAYQKATAKAEDAAEQFRGIRAELDRPINKIDISLWVFLVFAGALVLLEAPVNKFLFDVAIGGSNITSYIVSAGLAVFLLLMAHFSGKMIRQVYSSRHQKLVVTHLIGFIFLILICSIIIIVLTIGRAQYSASLNSSGGFDFFSGIGEQIVSKGFWEVIRDSFTDVNAIVLATINVAAVSAALFLAWFTHDPDQDYDKVSTDLKTANAKADNIDKRYNNKRNAIIKRFAPRLKNISARYADVGKRVTAMKSKLGMELDDNDKSALSEHDEIIQNGRTSAEIAAKRSLGDALNLRQPREATPERPKSNVASIRAGNAQDR